jgi:hypothetical protein
MRSQGALGLEPTRDSAHRIDERSENGVTPRAEHHAPCPRKGVGDQLDVGFEHVGVSVTELLEQIG